MIGGFRAKFKGLDNTVGLIQKEVKEAYDSVEEAEVDQWSKSVKMLGRDVDNDYNELQVVVENVDNQTRRCNARLIGLADGKEGGNLEGYLEELFVGCAVSDSKIKIKICQSS